MQPQEEPQATTLAPPTTSGLIMPQTLSEHAAGVNAPAPPPVSQPEAPVVPDPVDPTPDLSAAVEPDPAPAPTDEPEPEAPINAFSWQASEYIHHVKGAGWYLGLAAATIVLIAVAVLTKQWFAIAVFVAMFAAVIVYARKAPRTLTYVIDGDGITIENKLYHFSQFKSFSISHDTAWHTIDLEPAQRFAPRQTILFEEKDLDEITERLTAILPREDRDPDTIERAARYLRF